MVFSDFENLGKNRQKMADFSKKNNFFLQNGKKTPKKENLGLKMLKMA